MRPVVRVVQGHSGEIEINNAAGPVKSRLVNLVQGQRSIQCRRGLVEPLVFMLGPLDRLEDPLGLNDAHNLRGRGDQTLNFRV